MSGLVFGGHLEIKCGGPFGPENDLILQIKTQTQIAPNLAQ
jgi:hypothetical protein